jgi:osmotically-inducible protein OsmY
MNKLLATLLATALSATIAAAPAVAQSSEKAGYRKAMDKIEADHKAAKQKCDALKDEDVCEEQADVMRAKAIAAAVAKHDNTPANREAARNKLAEAEYELAEEKCDAMKGGDKDSCMTTAKSARTAAMGGADARHEGKTGKTAAAVAAGSAGMVASTDTKDPVKAAAVEKCEKQGNKGACWVENDGSKTAAADRTADRTADKTRMAASDAANRTEAAAGTAVAKTERAGERGAANVSDAMITTKVKAGLVKAPETSALAIKVETEKGVVMLSGFAESKAEADRAEQVAKGVEGVTSVKNSIKVK